MSPWFIGPRLLFLDEPTVGVDPQSRNHIFEEVNASMASGITDRLHQPLHGGGTVPLSARIGILDHGRLVACDNAGNLLRLLPGRIRFTLPPSRNLDGGVEIMGRTFAMFWNGTAATCGERGHQEPTFFGWRDGSIKKDWEPEFLHVEEPNLERVFLHLTGRALRDW